MAIFSIGSNFSYVEPKFGRRSKNWSQSVYYWWWKYLLHNEGYKAYCQDKKPKKKRDNFGKIFADFGNIYAVSFSEWWKSRGIDLFLEETIIPPIGIMLEYDWISPEDFVFDTPRDRLYICMPLKGVSKQKLKAEFCKIVDEYCTGARGRRTKQKVKVKYKVLGRPNVRALKTHLEIYELIKKHPDKPYWEIGRDIGLFKMEHYLRAIPDLQARNVMSATVSRHLRKARALIYNVGLGRFPDFTMS